MNKINYSDITLTKLEKIQDDLIIHLFDTRDKRFAISIALKKAFALGYNTHNTTSTKE